MVVYPTLGSQRRVLSPCCTVLFPSWQQWCAAVNRELTSFGKMDSAQNVKCVKVFSRKINLLFAIISAWYIVNREVLQCTKTNPMLHGLMYFPPDIVTPSTTVTHKPRSLLLQEPFAWTNAYKNSFLPRSTSNWNSLPNYVVLSPSVSSFKHSLSLYML